MSLTTSLKNLFFISSLLSFCLLTPLVVFGDELNEDQNIEGSAFDSMEDLVGEFDEELNDSDLEQAIKAESDESTEEPEPSPSTDGKTERTEVQVENDQAQVKVEEAKQVKAQSEDAQVSTAAANKDTKVKANALLVLKSKQDVKIWINKRYRGVIGAGKSRVFPVRAGRVVVTAKAKRKVRRYVKQVQAKTKTTAIIDLSTSKRARVRKGAKRTVKQRVRKATKKAIKKATKKSVKRATKKAIKARKKKRRD
uniref:Uncharacterized protein n=1 Tax=uncultured delta proteobacterium HF0010_08B07 TaxID=710821 RepID=E0XWU6_9DELT|nr:hypothetical protein [uncultured delta proteobacterium HF0010_08B07]